MIEFQYFDGCPNSEATLDNLTALIREGVISSSEVAVTEILGPDDAERKRFQGSPTILVDGKDIATGQIPDGYSYSCRTYSIDGIRTGVMSRSFIETRLHRLRQGH
jgi:hypothetical protein